MKYFAAAAVAAALAATGCASGPRVLTRTVVVEGWAPMTARSRPEARRQAVADAQRRAVEEVAGVELAAVASVDDAGRMRERVSTTGRGSLRGTRVLSESVRDGMMAVRVRAEVELPKAGAARRPGWIAGTGPRARFTGPAAAKAALRRAWTSYGGTGAADGGASDLILTAAVEESVVDEPRVKPFVAVRVRLAVDASSAAGGVVVWSASRERGALGVDARQARGRALEAAADAVANAAAEELPARLWLTARREER